MDLGRALEVAVEAARAAGDILRRDFNRPGGARGHGDKAEADTEAEILIRARLLQAFPSWGYLGEETGRAPHGAAGAPVWLVDPNDGTRDYLAGRRGSAVSIGLVAGRAPVLGVVFAFAYPDGEGDLFVWAEDGGPLLRNGRPATAMPPDVLRPSDVVLVSSSGDRDPETNLECVAPARYRTVPSIAHRLALVAAGEAAATSALFAPRDWDYAAGHALLRAAGGVLADESGAEVRYGEDGSSKTRWAVAGSAAVVGLLSRRPWETVRGGPGGNDRPARLVRGAAVADSPRLSRAQGCLLGQIAGNSLGSRAGDPPQRLEDGGRWQTLAGQPTGDSEMALALARGIVARGAYTPEAALEAYTAWLRSGPFDIDPATRYALTGDSRRDDDTSRSLARVSPLGVFAHGMAADDAAELGRRDSALTHPHPACSAAVGAFVAAVAHAIARGDGPEAAHRAALQWARRAAASAAVADALVSAASSPPVTDEGTTGGAAVVLQNAFFELLHAKDLEAAVVATVRRGGDTEANAAIAGALLGAVHGREAIPAPWRSMVLSCRSHALRAPRPRPRAFWPVDVLELAERLLLAGTAVADSAL